MGSLIGSIGWGGEWRKVRCWSWDDCTKIVTVKHWTSVIASIHFTSFHLKVWFTTKACATTRPVLLPYNCIFCNCSVVKRRPWWISWCSTVPWLLSSMLSAGRIIWVESSSTTAPASCLTMLSWLLGTTLWVRAVTTLAWGWIIIQERKQGFNLLELTLCNSRKFHKPKVCESNLKDFSFAKICR